MTQFASTLYPQTNPTNPILLKLREIEPSSRKHWIDGFLAAHLENYDWPNWSHMNIVHAYKVLKRLASLSG